MRSMRGGRFGEDFLLRDGDVGFSFPFVKLDEVARAGFFGVGVIRRVGQGEYCAIEDVGSVAGEDSDAISDGE